MRADTKTRTTLIPGREAALTVSFLWAMLNSAGTDITAWLTDLLLFFSTVLFNSLNIAAPISSGDTKVWFPWLPHRQQPFAFG